MHIYVHTHTHTHTHTLAQTPLSKSSAYLNKLPVRGDTAYVQKIVESIESLNENGSAGLGALLGSLMQAIFDSIHGMFFTYDEVFLNYVMSHIQKTT